jgi:hypothetical protein
VKLITMIEHVVSTNCGSKNIRWLGKNTHSIILFSVYHRDAENKNVITKYKQFTVYLPRVYPVRHYNKHSV